jgi:hypothetical protein
MYTTFLTQQLFYLVLFLQIERINKVQCGIGSRNNVKSVKDIVMCLDFKNLKKERWDIEKINKICLVIFFLK